MQDCLFCKIVKKEIPSTVVYEDDEIMAFKDIHPLTPVHILVIPKKHFSNILEVQEQDKELMGKIHLVINQIAKEQGVDKDGFRIVVNCGVNGGQEVQHLHFHLLAGTKLGTKIG